MNSETTEQNPYYYPAGIPVSPQARTFGYEFPVHVSKRVWKDCCSWPGDMPTKLQTNTDKRIMELLKFAYLGMTKKLSISDDFVQYNFDTWYWNRTRKTAKKKARVKLGARLFLHPETDTPWMLIFNLKEGKLNELKEGKKPEIPDDDSAGDVQADGSDSDVYRPLGTVLEGGLDLSKGSAGEEQRASDGRDGEKFRSFDDPLPGQTDKESA